MTDHDQYDAGKEKGLILGKLEALEVGMTDIKNAFNEFRMGTGQRVGEAEKQITITAAKVGIMEDQVMDLKKAKNWVVVTIIGAVILAVIGMVVKR